MTLLRSALALARRGFSVFPCYAVKDAGQPTARCGCPLGADCASPGKHPIGHTAAGRRGEGGVYAATRDAKQIRDWWGRWPALNPAVRTGLDDLVVLDVDGAAGFETLARLQGELGALPPTLAARSGRAEGGEHRWFRSAALAALGSRKVSPGLDLKAAGGYVVAPGARHKSGTYYAWTHDAVVAALPEAWEACALRQIEEKAQREAFERPRFEWSGDPGDKVGKLFAKLAAAPEGARNDTLNEVAFTAGGLHAGGQADDVRPRLLEAALAVGLDERESEATIRSGWDSGARRPLLPRPRQDPEELAAVQAAVAHLRTKKGEVHEGAEVAARDVPELRGAAAPPVRARVPAPRDVRSAPDADRPRQEKLKPLADELLLDLSRCAQRVAEAVRALEPAPAIDDDKRGFRVELARSFFDVLLANEVGVRACLAWAGMLDGHFLRDEPSLRLEPLDFWAYHTLKRQQRSQDNQGVQALRQLLGEVPAVELANAVGEAAKRWAALDPIGDYLKPFEQAKAQHARAKRDLLFVAKRMEEQKLAVDDRLRASFGAAIHCGDYCQIHRAECCDCAYSRQTRVCELPWCEWCGPRQRAARAVLAREVWEKHHQRLDLVEIDFDAQLPRVEVEALRRRVTNKLGRVWQGDEDKPRNWRAFETPGLLLFVCDAGKGAALTQAAALLRDERITARSPKTVDVASAVALVQRAWHERVDVIRAEVRRVVLFLRTAKLGEVHGAQAAHDALLRLAEGGWATATWTHGSRSSHEELPWPSREDVRDALKKKATEEREAAGRPLSSKPPEKCPVHGGAVLIDLEHVPTRRVVAAKLRHPVILLDAVRLDEQRLIAVPAKKKRPRPCDDPAFVAYWKAKSDAFRARHAALHGRE